MTQTYFKRIGDLIPPIDIEKLPWDQKLFLHWEDVVGKDLSSLCLPHKFDRERKIFYINPKAPQHAFLLHYKQNVLIEKIKAWNPYGPDFVIKIR